MNRAFVFAIFIGAFILTNVISSAEIIGVSLNSSSDPYQMAAGASPAVSLLSLLIFLLIIRSPWRTGTPAVDSRVALSRRFIAFLIDLFFAMAVIAPPMALPVLIKEASATGTFAWSFERDFSRPGDMMLSITGVIISFGWLLMYWSVPLLKQRQTAGQYIMGYSIVSGSGGKVTLWSAAGRTICSFVSLCALWITGPLALFNKNRYMLHDRRQWFVPVLIDYRSKEKVS